MAEEDGCKEAVDFTCIHWGYLNVLQFNDVSGKKIKHPSWSTYWADLCGSTLRLYKDISLPKSNCDFPPSTMIGPRPESQIKYAFFSLKNGSLRDDASENSPRLQRKHKLARKHVLQIVLGNFSVYYLQAPTMSAFYRWRTKIQSSMDNADSSEKLCDKQLRDAKIAMYEQQRCHFQPDPTYPETAEADAEDEEFVQSASKDPRVTALKEKLLEKERFLRQLEKQEKDFLGSENDNKCALTRIEFSATARKNYFLVVGQRDTLISEGQTFTIFGRLPNKRWRCCMNREDRLGSRMDKREHEEANYMYPLIGSVPTSVILELNQPSRIKELVDSISVSSSNVSSPKEPDDEATAFNYDVVPPISTHSAPYSNHKQSVTLTSNHSPPTIIPSKITPSGKLDTVFNNRLKRPSESSISPASPNCDTPTQVSDVISDLNKALKTLTALHPRKDGTFQQRDGPSRIRDDAPRSEDNTPRSRDGSHQSKSDTLRPNDDTLRSRLSSNVSISSCTSNSSQDDDSSDLSRGSRIEVVSDEESSRVGHLDHDVVRRRRRRDIQISRKLHAKGISLIVGSSSSSEDEDDYDEDKKNSENNEPKSTVKAPNSSRKIEEFQSSKEKLTEKVTKGVKSAPENSRDLPNGDRLTSSVDKPTTTDDLLRDFSENGCYGLPIRNSVTQAQFKPLASHEIPPPLHQRRTLQMTRREEEGFGFVLQTNTVVRSDAYSDSMTFVSNVSEDGPAYLAGMRPGDVIIEVENTTVEDDDHQMIIECLKTAGLTIRLVVVYKDAVQRMRLSTRLLALKARLEEAKNAYDTLEKKEQMIMDHVKDAPLLDTKVRMAVMYVHIQIASTTFARDTPDIKNSVVQTKRTPSELLQLDHSPDLARNCGLATTGYELLREFSTSCEEGLENKATSPKYASDTALDATKKRKVGEGLSKQKTLKQTQRSSFVSYVDFNTDTTPSRRRVKSDSYDPDENSTLTNDTIDQFPCNKALPAQFRRTRPESYMIALGSQNAIDTSHFRESIQPRINESSLEEDFV